MDTPTVLSLYSGAGGLDVGFRLAIPGARTVCYVEREITSIGVLTARFKTGDLDDAPIWDDANTFDGNPWRGKVDWVIGGPPCQPFSTAGSKRGAEDPRNGWPNTLRVVREVQPAACFFENVASTGLIHYYWWEVRSGLQALGYRVTEIITEAADAGHRHHRRRTFILAYRDGEESGGSSGELDDPDWRRRSEQAQAIRARRDSFVVTSDVVDANVQRRRSWYTERQDAVYVVAPGPRDSAGWATVLERRPDLAPATQTQSEIRGVAYGLARGLARTDKLRILGNSVVPQQAALSLAAMIGAIK